MPRKRITDKPLRPFIKDWTPEVFWSFAKPADGGCLLWQRGARVYYQRRYDRAHRIAYRISHGEIPPGKYVIRTCGQQLCVQPAHLLLGDSADVERAPRRDKMTPERFWSFTRQEPNGCIVWTKQRDKAGYGRLTFNGKAAKLAHRVAYEITHGPFPSDLDVMHSCDNRPCVNPAHLSLGTHQDNMRDMVLKGRTCAKLSNADIERMKQLKDVGFSLTVIAGLYDIGVPTASQIVNGKARRAKAA